MAHLSYDKIEEYADIERHRIKPAISVLLNAGLVHVERTESRSNDRGTANAYRLAFLDSYFAFRNARAQSRLRDRRVKKARRWTPDYRAGRQSAHLAMSDEEFEPTSWRDRRCVRRGLADQRRRGVGPALAAQGCVCSQSALPAGRRDRGLYKRHRRKMGERARREDQSARRQLADAAQCSSS